MGIASLLGVRVIFSKFICKGACDNAIETLGRSLQHPFGVLEQDIPVFHVIPKIWGCRS